MFVGSQTIKTNDYCYRSKILLKQTRTQQQAIAKFKYHLNVVIPSYLLKKTHLDFLLLRNFTNQNGMTYYYGEMNITQKQPIHNQLLNNQFIYGFEKLLSHHGSKKLQHGTYIKSTQLKINGLLKTFQQVSEMVQIVIVQDQQKPKKSNLTFNKTFSTSNSWQAFSQASFIQSLVSTQQKNVFIIHRCSTQNQNNLQWSNFVQQYSFKKNYIEYKMVFSAKVQPRLLKIGNNSSSIDNFIKQYCSEQHINKYIGILNQLYLQKKSTIEKVSCKPEKGDPAFSDQHIRLLHLPPQQYHFFQNLRQFFGPNISDNLICRFIKKNMKQSELQKTKLQIVDYLEWREQFKEKYTFQDFKEFIQMDIIRYIGEDKKGRPVLMGFPFRIDIENIDVAKFRDFMLYFLEIEMPKKCRGYVDNYTIVGDIKHFSTKNFSFYAARTFAPIFVKYVHERLGKAIAINVSSFAYYVYQFLKNTIVEQATSRKLTIVEENEQQIYKTLQENISNDYIPSYLGGKSHIQSWPNYPKQ